MDKELHKNFAITLRKMNNLLLQLKKEKGVMLKAEYQKLNQSFKEMLQKILDDIDYLQNNMKIGQSITSKLYQSLTFNIGHW